MQEFKNTLGDIMPLKMQERSYYADFSKFLSVYEEAKDKKSQQVGELAHIRLVSGQGGDYLKSKLEGLAQDFQNPMMHINNWVKGEVYSLDALVQCANEVQNTETLKKKTIADIADLKMTIEKLNGGKFTFGGLLKSDTDKKQSAIPCPVCSSVYYTLTR